MPERMPVIVGASVRMMERVEEAVHHDEHAWTQVDRKGVGPSARGRVLWRGGHVICDSPGYDPGSPLTRE